MVIIPRFVKSLLNHSTGRDSILAKTYSCPPSAQGFADVLWYFGPQASWNNVNMVLDSWALCSFPNTSPVAKE